MNKQAVAAAYLRRYLTDGLQKRLRFNIAGRAADFRDDNIGAGLFADRIDKRLDFVGNVRDNLYGFAQIIAAAFLVQNVPVYLASGEVGILVQILVNEAFVVTEIQIGFRAVLRDVHLAVLERAHRARVNVDVWVELLCCDLETAGFEQPAKRSGSDALAKAGNNAAGYKDILCHNSILPSNTVVAGPVRNTASSV